MQWLSAPSAFAVNAILARLEQRVAERRGDLSMEEMQVDGIIDALEKERVLSETIIVVDAGKQEPPPPSPPSPPRILANCFPG